MSKDKKSANILLGISVLPALLVMPAMAGVAQPVDGVVSNQTVYNQSGGLYNLKTLDSDLLISGSRFFNNDNSDSGWGAVAHATGGHTLTVSGSEFIGNYASVGGGAVSSGTGAAGLIINGSTFTDNHAREDGGAVASYRNLSITNSVFENNTAQYEKDENGEWKKIVAGAVPIGGGALALGAVSEAKIASISSTTFKNNASGVNGGAIGTRLASDADNKDAKLDISATFEKNFAENNGGAIYNTFYANNGMGKGDGVTVSGNFIGNIAGVNGGAIYNDGALDKAETPNGGVMTLNNAKFTENKVTGTEKKTGQGGAIFNSGTLNVNGGEFTGNNASKWAGAIYNGDGGSLVINGATFTENSSKESGGAVVSGTAAVKTEISNTLFSKNFAADIGALGLFSGATLTNVKFENNSATSAASGMDGAGAIFLGAVSKTVMDNVEFTKNTSELRGGAISTRSGDVANNKDARLDILNSRFVGNTAKTTGGAIDNYLYSSQKDITAVYIENTTFDTNNALNGGAIYNHGEPDKEGNEASLRLSDVVFQNNYATANGGAIYNEFGGGITLDGINTFTKNTYGENKASNDIYNDGLLNIASGTTSISGGIMGDGTTTVATGAVLNIGTSAINQAAMTLNGTLIATLSGDVAQINITDTFDGTGTVKLVFDTAGTYHVFGDKVFNNIDLTNSVYDLEWSESKKDLVATFKSVESIASDNGLTDDAAQMIANVTNSTSASLNDLGVKIQETLAMGDTASVEGANKAINPEKASVVQSVSTSVQNTVTTLASNRMSIPAVGRSGGDVTSVTNSVWAQGVYNKTKLNDVFDSDTRGVAAGIDGTINGDITVGAGYAYNHSDVALDSRDTEIDSHSIFVYGQYKPSEWYINATLNYTMSDFAESGNALGVLVASDYNTSAFGAQLMTGYDFADGITPEFGLRYLYVKDNTYTNSLGIQNSTPDANYMTAVLGTKYAFDIMAGDRTTIRPELRYAVKYDLISDMTSTIVTMPGLTPYALTGDRLSRLGAEFGLGLTVNYDGIDLSVSYDIEVRDSYTSQTGMFKAKYNF